MTHDDLIERLTKGRSANEFVSEELAHEAAAMLRSLADERAIMQEHIEKINNLNSEQAATIASLRAEKATMERELGILETSRDAWRNENQALRAEKAKVEEDRAIQRDGWRDAALACNQHLAEIASLRAKLDGPPPLDQEIKHLDGQIKTLLKENEALRAKLEGAREALDKIAHSDYAYVEPGAIARATLEELK